MPNLDALTPQQAEQISDYLAGLLPDEQPLVCQVVSVYWPDQTRSYLFSPIYQQGKYEPINDRKELGLIEGRLRQPYSKPFYRITVTADVNDNPLQVEFHEGPQFDYCVREQFEQTGENQRGEVFLYFPAIDLLYSEFVGHFKAPTGGSPFHTPVTLMNGFKSRLMQLPDFRIGWNGCQWIFGPLIRDPLVRLRNGCRYNLDLPVLPAGMTRLGTNDPVTGGPRTFCPKTNRAVCDEVMGTDPDDPLKHFGGSDTVYDQSFLGYLANRKNLTNTYNLESRAKNPLGILAGSRKKFPLSLVQAARQDPLSSNGTLLTRWLISFGPIQTMRKFTLRGKNPQGQEVRLGTYLQPPLNNFPGNTGTDPGNLSLIATCSLNENPVKSAEITFDQIQAEGDGDGFTEVRHYNADGTFTDKWSASPTWWIRLLLEHPRFGLRITPNYFINTDWLACDAADQADGLSFNHYIQGGIADKVFEDICRSMRKSVPFWHGGKLRIVPIGREQITDAVPTFYAQGPLANILEFDGSNLQGMPAEFKGIAAIRPLKKSDDEIPRRVLLTFDDDPNEVYERVFTAEAAKLMQRDAEASRDAWNRITEKEAVGIGITNEVQAKAQAIYLLEEGEFGRWGTRNNAGFELVAKGIDPMVLNLHPWALCRVFDDNYAYLRDPGPEYKGDGSRFTEFRVFSKTRDENLQSTLTVCAYPKDRYEVQA